MIIDDCNTWLRQFVADCDAIAGTVHVHEGEGLRLVAAVNIPEKVQQIVEWVPSGKGMAGQALLRGEPIFTCNLKDDSSGAVRPGAKAVDAAAAIALPLRDQTEAIVAVVGIAFANERLFSPAEMDAYIVKATSFLSQF